MEILILKTSKTRTANYPALLRVSTQPTLEYEPARKGKKGAPKCRNAMPDTAARTRRTHSGTHAHPGAMWSAKRVKPHDYGMAGRFPLRPSLSRRVSGSPALQDVDVTRHECDGQEREFTNDRSKMFALCALKITNSAQSNGASLGICARGGTGKFTDLRTQRKYKRLRTSG